MKSMVRGMRFCAILSIVLAMLGPAHAQSYPERPIRLVVPFPPGGSTDVVARILAQDLSTTLKQNVIVENKAGAAGTIGIQVVAQAKPDGYTFGVSGVGPVALIPLIDKKLAYDPVKDLDVVAIISTIDLMFAAKPGGKKSLKEILEFAKNNPEKVAYGSAGAAGPIHVQFEYLAKLSGASMLDVQYPGDAPQLFALMSGQIDVGLLSLSSATGAARDGKIIPLAVGSPSRVSSFPDLPTVVEATGLKDYSAYVWTALVAPKGTPKEALDKVNAALNAALNKPEIKERLDQIGMQPLGGDVKAANEFIDKEIARYKTMVAVTGVKRE
ncbi:tripartite tricarboxylate transporter substrate binding protein [Vineibacter terrae]|uniref:Tripartite tricarboxylate transporter substrate binding protein n=1 Tax=Vineibacter terrae TaxID=2586908 RepID=A0A5C8PUC4_9HYPH|nr:tripartite tricarboxylate transporter substrate binding protein [Vineibacter terrae]TXL81681.1 tripartite tricarboxylate transporter substrate binding protein [Vineibacter terrae]